MDKDSFNYSFYEFFYNVQSNITREEIRKNIKNIFSAFFVKKREFNYIIEMIFIVEFLLCFLDEESTFYLFCEILEKILPMNYFQKVKRNDKERNGYSIEKEILCEIGKSLRIFDDVNGVNINKFLSDNIQFFSKLMINELNFQNTYYIWNSMISNGVKNILFE